jgi:hypothetical protein
MGRGAIPSVPLVSAIAAVPKAASINATISARTAPA